MKPMYCKGPEDKHWRRMPEPTTWPVWLGLAAAVVVLMLVASRALAEPQADSPYDDIKPIGAAQDRAEDGQ